MATVASFSGTNTEKIDQLIQAVVEIRTTIRIMLTAIGVGFPLVLGLQVFLVTKSFDHSNRLDRIEDRLTRIEEKVFGFEKDVRSLDERVRGIEKGKNQ